MGMSVGVADLMLEMYGSMREKKVLPTGDARITSMTFAQFAADIFQPALAKAAEAEG